MTRTIYPPPDPDRMIGIDRDSGDAPVVTRFGPVKVIQHGRFREVWNGSIAWMGTHPDWWQRYPSHDELVEVATGHALVSGLGCAFDSNRISGLVDSMNIVEISAWMIAACSQFAPANATIIESPIDDYLTNDRIRAPIYDTVYFDHSNNPYTTEDRRRYHRLLEGWLKPDANVVFWD